MKKCLLIIAMLFGVTALPKIEARGLEPGWYVRGFGGWNYIENLPCYNSTFEVDGGYLVGGSIGYKLAQLIRVETEIAFRENKFTNWVFINGYIPIEGQVKTLTFMTNAIVDFPFPGEYVRPYAGGGIGYGRTQRNIIFPPGLLIENRPLPNIECEDSNFVYQGTAGLSFEFFEKADFRFAYTYLDGSETEGNHSISLSLKQYF